MADPLPGHLSRSELAELMGPVEHFHFFALDESQPHYAWNREHYNTDVGTMTLFNFTKGSGRALIGEPDDRVALIELAGEHAWPHFRVVRESLLQRIRELFGEKGPGSDVLTKDLLAQIESHAIDVDIEGDERWIAFSRGGAMYDGDHEPFMREVLPLAFAFHRGA